MQTAETKFREIRESVYASREDVVRRTKSVSLSTIRNVELGKPVRRDTARQLLEAVNALLSEAGKPAVTLGDLGLISQESAVVWCSNGNDERTTSERHSGD